MKVSIIVATHGGDEWRKLAAEHAMPSAKTQGAYEVFSLHTYDATLAAVRNLAAMEASGDWLCFLDADDQLADGYVAAMEHVNHTTELGLRFDRLYVPAIEYLDGDVSRGEAAIPSWGRPLIEINCAVIGTLIARREFLRLGGFRDLPMYEDWDLWLRAVVAGAKLVPVPAAVYRADAAPGRNVQPALAEETYWRIRNEHELAFLAATA